MAYEIPDHYSRSFTTNVELLLQQKSHRLMGTYTVGAYQGEAAQVVKQFGTVEFQERFGRQEDTTFSDIQHKQRWVHPVDYDLALPVEKVDDIRQLNSPLSSYVSAMVAAANRKKDSILVDALFGTSYTGKLGTTSNTFDSNNTVAVTVGNGGSGNVGLNIEKLRAARLAMKQAYAIENESGEKPVICVTAKQKDDLLAETQVTSSDYAAVKALVDGEVDYFMGFRFVEYEDLPTDSSSFRRCPVWVPSGLHLGQWNGLETRIGERADKKYLTQIYMNGTWGSCRTQEAKVHEILCAES